MDPRPCICATCPACGNEADMVLYGNGRAACSICGTAAHWAYDHVEPD